MRPWTPQRVLMRGDPHGMAAGRGPRRESAMTSASSAIRTGRSTRPLPPLRSFGPALAVPRPTSSTRSSRGSRLGLARRGLVGVGRDLARRHRGDASGPGGKQIDAVRILASDLGTGCPLDVPAGDDPELVTDERPFRAALTVAVRGWGRKEPGQAQVDRDLPDALRDLADWTGFRVLACADGEPPVPAGAR